MKLNKLIAFIATSIIVFLILSVPVWLIWNYVLINVIAGLSEIGIFQAFAMMIFVRIFTVTVSLK